MIHTTRWQPDTCGCVVEYEWDDSVDEKTRVHSLTKITRCPYHETLTKNGAYSAVIDENTTKNKVHGIVLENFPDLVNEVKNDDGSISKRLKPEVEFKWSFDVDRKLQVELVGITKENKTKLQNLVNTKIAAQKADII
jgi:hypothetical protein